MKVCLLLVQRNYLLKFRLQLLSTLVNCHRRSIGTIGYVLRLQLDKVQGSTSRQKKQEKKFPFPCFADKLFFLGGGGEGHTTHTYPRALYIATVLNSVKSVW
jgi:hypothetical protein